VEMMMVAELVVAYMNNYNHLDRVDYTYWDNIMNNPLKKWETNKNIILTK
jgi:hypothetical protein